MKKIFWIAVLVLAYVYVSGYYSLSEAGVVRFLGNMEEASMKGDAQAVCDMLADEVQVSLSDQSSREPVNLQGGKEQLCELLRKTLPLQAALISSSSVRRDDLTVKRGWLHCWTADVSYTEHRAVTVERAGVTFRTVSEDKLTLEKTFTHVAIKRIETAIRRDTGA
jgi:hypothetical protein